MKMPRQFIDIAKIERMLRAIPESANIKHCTITLDPTADEKLYETMRQGGCDVCVNSWGAIVQPYKPVRMAMRRWKKLFAECRVPSELTHHIARTASNVIKGKCGITRNQLKALVRTPLLKWTVEDLTLLHGIGPKKAVGFWQQIRGITP